MKRGDVFRPLASSTERAAQGPRKPLRTAKEMAEEFGVPVHVVVGLLGREGAPKPKIDGRMNHASRLCWYEVAPFRKWLRDALANR